MSRITNANLEAQIKTLAAIGTPAGKSWCLDKYNGGYRLVLRANDTGGIENISALSTRRELYHIIDGILAYTRIMNREKGKLNFEIGGDE